MAGGPSATGAARALFAQVKGEGYGGGYTLVSDFIRAWRRESGQSQAGRALGVGQ